MHQLRQLRRGGAGHLRVGVAQVADRQAGDEIEIFLAGIIPHPAALALNQHQGLPAIGVHDDRIRALSPMVAHNFLNFGIISS
jgi:hypothetical protein